MKRIIITLVGLTFLVVTATASFSQGRGNGGEGRGYGNGDCPRQGGHKMHHKKFMKEELELTDEQEQEIFDIGTKYRKLFFENRKDQEKVKELHEEKREAIKDILTDDQKQKLKEKREKRRGRRGNRNR